ncbi:MAG TPA: phage holin family protein [Steroidobacteraceae bacterium]|nr:phage holin family protein [Steroidobacteraceae bacterium]
MADAAPDAGLIESLRRVCTTLVELAHTRVELVAVEVEEQIGAIAKLLLWGAAAIYFASLAVLFLAASIIIACWDSHRLLAALAVTCTFALAAVGAAWGLRRGLRRRPRFLAATSGELKRDAAALNGDSP